MLTMTAKKVVKINPMKKDMHNYATKVLELDDISVKIIYV